MLAAVALGSLSAPTMAQEKAAEGQKAAEKTEVKKLTVGDPAPKVEVEKFVKGTPVTGFEKGKVYVVEFWATWCGPCIRAFPHLSELQAKHKDKVTFIGVNVWEEDEYTADTLKNVEKFVTGQGDKMAYTVAFDGKAKKTDTAYMKATGQNGIPAAFIVDSEGRVAWMGHPMGMDKVLEDVVAGKWDLAKAQKEAADAKAAEAKRMEGMKKAQPIIGRMRDAMEEEKWDDAVKAMDELKALDPETFGNIDATKFDVLLTKAKQPEKAYGMKDALLANKALSTNPQAMNQIAWSVVNPENEIGNRDADFALAFAIKADELAKSKDAAIIDTLARCYWVKGDKAKAIELQEKAVKLAGEDEQMADMKSDLEDTLKDYKAKK